MVRELDKTRLQRRGEQKIRAEEREAGLALRWHVFAAEKIHADDTPVPVLEPGLGRTRTGRLWVYVRDDRPFCGPAPPAAVYLYSPDRRGEHPAAHLAPFTGFLQADAYSGFAALYEPRIAAPGLPAMPAITEVASSNAAPR